ncbi:NF-kappa-B inhibitor-like protein 1 [Mercenaria mercenaria]|uniref:NF-kappa-B inhibitor-like protein 1 n=1 Tax=Mercenaria mercenaria TaxID=6596 RepID=UPI00234EA414|nr:NF-kappa-B inhibitor-like protein 1 [Mercenaria mercenaria]XP_053380434.1 NF-kappa-B inhibitor-like protein 1 [Mercenaria mercenaria]
MSSSQIISKVKRYIEEDRPRRLRTYVKKHHINLSDITLNKGRNLLHYCCKHGFGPIMKYLLSEGVSCLDRDTSLNTPVHVALHRALTLEDEGKTALTTQCYTEMILPLIERFPGSLDMRNKSGESCRNLLHTLVQRREPSQKYEDSKTGVDSDLDETAWRDKLADECQYEYSTAWGKYEQGFTSYEAENETYDDWADRIREEFYARKRASSLHYQSAESTRQKSKRKHSDTGQQENESLESARAKMRKKFEENRQQEREMDVLKKRMKYEQRYKQLLENNFISVLRFDDIPWPSVKGQEHDITVLFEGMDKAGMEYKKYLRDQQIRWHPDKFLQRFGRYLDSAEKEKVVQRVTVLSQNLNKLVT